MAKRAILILLLPVLIAAASAMLLRYVYSAFTNPSRSWQIAVAIDASTNVSANGTWGQTISYRAAKARADRHALGCTLCWLLNRIDAGHCDRALLDRQQDLT
ncbi:MAG: hypothetical protein WC426_14075 [Sulfuriferula sp.]